MTRPGVPPTLGGSEEIEMDPISVALIAAVTKLAESGIQDAYEGLKKLIVKKFGGRHALTKAVQDLETKPASAGRRETLQEEVTASKAAGDEELLAAANALLEQLKKLPGGQQLVQQTVTGDHNIFSGSGNVNVSGRET